MPSPLKPNFEMPSSSSTWNHCTVQIRSTNTNTNTTEREMASGWRITGNKGRCYNFGTDFCECMYRCRDPKDCSLLREDYLECLHHSKETPIPGTLVTFPYSVTTTKLCWPFILFLLIESSHGAAAARQMGWQESDASTHSNFFRSALRGRQRFLSCADDPSVCLDHEKNPWGGNTCCLRQFCKDITSDLNHCGSCGHACAYGHVCCDGKCVDIQNDPHNCGSCFEECLGKNRCSFAMCDYGG